ncbi:hypothetical protein R3P38DRAFT_2551496, partial [Favolaschia claudopus]
QLSRADLVALVQQEPTKWPKDVKGTFLKWKTNMPDMIWALVNCDYTTDLPAPSPSLPNASSAGQSVEASRLGTGGNSEDRSLNLLITDIRNIFNITKCSQQITVPIANKEDCEPNEWRASARDVVAALQLSISAFEGSARLGTPDEEEGNFVKFFGIARDGVLQSTDEDEYLLIPSNGKLNLTLAKIKLMPPPREPWVELEDHIKRQSRSPPSPAATRVRRPPHSFTAAEQNWLTARAQEMDGYTKFIEDHNRRLNNLERVKYWNFAAQFTEKYFAKTWPLDISRSTDAPKIKKQDIEVVLRLKSTALAQAINMSRILRTHYFGSAKSEAVVKVIEGSGDFEPAGSDALAKFLAKWDREHPGVAM